MDSQDRATVMVLGARLGGTHIIRTLLESGMAIRGVYDQHADAQGLVLARDSGIPVCAGHFDQLNELFRICEADPESDFTFFLPSRDRRFIDFVQRLVRKWQSKGVTNFTLVRMDEDFLDYAPAHELLALVC